MIKKAAKFAGAAATGICKLDRRWIYSKGYRLKECVEFDIDVPDDCAWVINMVVEMPYEPVRYMPTYLGSSATGIGYSRMAIIAVEWMTCLGGVDEERVFALTARMPGSVFVGGSSTSKDFPTTSGAIAQKLDRLNDGVFARLDSGTGRLLYASFIGAKATSAAQMNDNVRGLAANSNGDLFVTGFTRSVDHLVTPNAFQRRVRGNAGPFVLRLRFPDFRRSKGDP